LRTALADLKAVGALAAWRIDEASDSVHVNVENRRIQGGTTTPANGVDARPALPVASQPLLPLELHVRPILFAGVNTDQCVLSQKFHCVTIGTHVLSRVQSAPNPSPTLSLIESMKPSCANTIVPREPNTRRWTVDWCE